MKDRGRIKWCLSSFLNINKELLNYTLLRTMFGNRKMLDTLQEVISMAIEYHSVVTVT